MTRKFMSLTLPVLAGVALLCTPLLAQEQGRWRVEVLPGAAVPTHRFGGADPSTGWGFEGNISYRFMPHLATYGGWNWHSFKSDLPFAEADMDVEENGYVFGLRFEHPIRGSESPTLMLRAGGTYNHIELENSAGSIKANSGHGLGWEAGAGVGFRLSDTWRLTPGMRFRSLSRDFTFGSIATPVKLRYVTLEVGFSKSF